jgi:hypothetical protein
LTPVVGLSDVYCDRPPVTCNPIIIVLLKLRQSWVSDCALFSSMSGNP